MTLNPYLNFPGTCADAFDFYKSVFGGDLMISTFADAPADMNVPESAKDKIMHVSLPVGGGVLMGSDVIEGFGGPHKAGTNFSISLEPKSKEEADRVFDKLSAGGDISMPMQNTFWGAYFGSLTDKFGISWMINFPTRDQ